MIKFPEGKHADYCRGVAGTEIFTQSVIRFLFTLFSKRTAKGSASSIMETDCHCMGRNMHLTVILKETYIVWISSYTTQLCSAGNGSTSCPLILNVCDAVLTCAGHSDDVARFADRVIHDGHDTKLIPRLLCAEDHILGMRKFTAKQLSQDIKWHNPSPQQTPWYSTKKPQRASSCSQEPWGGSWGCRVGFPRRGWVDDGHFHADVHLKCKKDPSFS